MKFSFKSSTARNQLGYGLIEILIAIAVLAVLALLISQSIPQQQKTVFQTTDRAECQNRLQNILSGIKKYDNQIQADSWLPGNGRPDNLDPRLNANIQWANTRITKNLLGNFPSPVYPTGQVLVPPAQIKTDINFTRQRPGAPVANFDADAVVMTDYFDATHHELDVVQYANVWQLAKNAATLLYPYYNDMCNGNPVDFTTGFIGTAIGATQLNNEIDTIQIERVNLDTGAILPCADWEPLPLNSNPSNYFSAAIAPLGSVNHKIGYKVTARVAYQDRSNQNLSCEGNTTVSPGAYLNPVVPADGVPRLATNVNIRRITRTGAGFLPSPNYLSCDPPPNEVGWEIGRSCGSTGCEQGIAYLCRLDYMGVKDYLADPNAVAPSPTPQVVFPQRTTGWFVCSLPPAGLDARANGQLTSLSIEAVNDANGFNLMQVYLTGKIWEGQYRMHVMGVDRARNIAIKASNIYVDTEAPIVTALNPPSQIQAMGFYTTPRYGHLGAQTIPRGPRVGDPPSSNSPWDKLKDSFTNIAGPHENLFQCQASAGAWTVTSGGNGVGDLNVASNNSPGLAYGPVGAVLNPTCGIQPGYTAPGSGEYQVQAIACDACQHLGGTRTRRWYADLENVNPNPTVHSNSLNRGQAVNTYMSFTRTSTLKTLNYMPVAHSCERYNGATPDWAASLTGTGGAGVGQTYCLQSDWEAAFGDSCTSDPTSIPQDDQCFIAVDGCGRFTARPFNTNYQVHGGTITAPASRDCCSGVTASPYTGFGNAPSCSNDGASAMTDFVCSDGSLTSGTPMCARTSEIEWTGVRANPRYTLPTCNPGDQTCQCWKDSECYNNLERDVRASCSSGATVTCDGPYTGATCPAGYVMNGISLNGAKILYTSATTDPPVNDGDPCVIPNAVTCSLSGGPAITPTPSPIPAGQITGGTVKYNVSGNYCNLPTAAPLGRVGCTSNRCPVMTNACTAAAPPVPPPAVCAGTQVPCIVGDPRWTSCAGVPLCGDPVCPGDPASYQWSNPAFDPAILAQCSATSGITAASCSSPNTFFSIPTSVPRVAPGIQCMNGGSAVQDFCCSDPRPPTTTICNINSCAACPAGAAYVYDSPITWGACGYAGQNDIPRPATCNGYAAQNWSCCDTMYEAQNGTCMAGATSLPDSCCGSRRMRSCGCSRQWACVAVGGRPGLQCW